MPERSVFIRVAIKDGDRAIADLKKLGINGEKAINRITKATKPAKQGGDRDGGANRAPAEIRRAGELTRNRDEEH